MTLGEVTDADKQGNESTTFWQRSDRHLESSQD